MIMSLDDFEGLRQEVEKDLKDKTNYRTSRVKDIDIIGVEYSYGLFFYVTKGIFRRAVAEVLIQREGSDAIELKLFDNRDSIANLQTLEEILRRHTADIKVTHTRKTNFLYEQFFVDRYK